MANELATAYISLIPETSKIAPGVRKALGQVDVQAEKSGQSLGGKLASGMGKTLKVGAKSAGVAAAGALTGALAGGFKRLDAIDQAKAKFAGLGKTAQEQAAIMDDVTKSVKGTSFATNEAADAAAMFLAAGIKPGKQLTGVLKTVGDSASFANKSFADIAPIFTKAKNSGKVMGDTLEQLSDNGIPAVQGLAKHLGITAQEVYDLGSKGKISFEDLQAAMDETLGGQALKSGETFSGAMDNAKAAMSRFGASILEPAFKAMPGVLTGITGKIDDLTAAVGPVAEEWSKKIGGALSDFSKKAAPEAKAWLSTLGDAASALADAAKSAAPVFKSFGKVLGSVPFEAYAGLAAAATAKHVGLTGALSKTSGGLTSFISNVKSTRSTLRDHGVDIGVVGSALDVVGQKYPAVEKMTQAFNDAATPLRTAGSVAKQSGQDIGGMEGFVKKAEGAVQVFGGTAKGVASGGMSLLKSGATGIMNAFGGPWGLAITGAGVLLGGLAKAHEEAARKEQEHRQKQQELRDSFEQTTGKITEQTEALQLKSLEESGARKTGTKLGLSQDTMAKAMTGNAEAMATVNDTIDRQADKASKANDAWGEYGDSLEGMGITYQDIANASEGVAGAQEKIRQKISDAGYTDEAYSHWYDITKKVQNDMGDTEGAAAKLRGEIGTLNSDFEESNADVMAEQVNRLSDESGKATKAMDILGDHAMKLGEKPNELVVDLSEMSDGEQVDIQKRLKDIGLESKLENGSLTIDFKSAAGILASLDEIEGKVNWMPDGTIDINSNTKEVNEELERMGVLGRDQHGNFHMEDNLRDVMTRLVETNVFQVDPKTGTLTISSNAQEIWDDAQNKLNSPNGDTSSKHVITEEYLASTAALYGGADKDRSVVRNLERKKRGHADGGLIPKSANGRMIGGKSGYKLPTSGPGTSTTDGILGRGADGTPTSWVDAGEWVVNAKSSAKYHDLLEAINSGNYAAIQAAAQDSIPGLAGGGVAQSFGAGGANVSMGMDLTGALGEDAAGGPFAGLTTSFQNMASTMASTASTLVTPALSGLTTGISALGTGFQTATTMQAIPSWMTFGGAVASVKSSYIDPAMAGVRGGVASVGNSFVSAVSGRINPAWASAGNTIMSVKTGTIDPAFAGIQGGLSAVVGAFANGATGIGNQWNRVRSATSEPARFAIESVFNQGIVGMWNSVSDFLGTDKMSPYRSYNFATGGHVRGPGGPTDDKIPAWLSDGEYVMNAKAVKRIGLGNLNALNGGAMSMAPDSLRNRKQVDAMLGDKTMQNIASRYAGGGIVKGSDAWKALLRGYNWARSQDGKPYIWAQQDCSWFMSSIADKILGGAGTRQWATGNFPGTQQGAWAPGLASGFSVGISSEHTAGTIGGVEGIPAVNVESGGANSRVKFGAADAAGANDGQFSSRHHLIYTGDGKFVGGAGGGASMGQIVANLASEASKKYTEAAAGWASSHPGLVNQTPSGVAKSLGGAAREKIDKLTEEMMAFTSGNAESYRGMIRAAYKRQGLQWTQAKEDAWVRQIQSESGGVANITQQIQDVNSGGNEAQGVLQVTPTTFAASRDPELPNDPMDPWANINAAIRYAEPKYGDGLLNQIGHGNGYDEGGYLEPKGTQVVHNDSGKPEPVFTHAQWQVLRKAVAKAVDVDWNDLSTSAKDIQVASGLMMEAADAFSDGAATKAADTFSDSQLSDALGVFGFSSPKDWPLAKAAEQLTEATKDYDKEKAKEYAESRGVTATDESLAQGQALTKNLASLGAAVSTAAATPSPESLGTVGALGGQTVNISVDNASRAFSEFRKLQALASAGAVGV